MREEREREEREERSERREESEEREESEFDLKFQMRFPNFFNFSSFSRHTFLFLLRNLFGTKVELLPASLSQEKK